MFESDTIIFDFGGVILPIDFNRTIQAFRKLGMDLGNDFSFMSQNPIFDQWDRGLVTSQDILTFFRSKLPDSAQTRVTDQELTDAWNAILGRIPEHRLEWLEKLSRKKPLYLLSNTNSIHIETLRKLDPLMSRFEKVFQRAYYSYEMKQRKPDAECFLTIVDNHGLEIKRTLFVDDHPKNIEAASRLGFQTLHCTGEITQMLE